MAKDLSILIPANNEIFLARTIQDILENIEADTEVIAVLDGSWAKPPIPQNDRVNVIYVPESIGQRAATNLGAKLSQAKYVMKVDAHCAFDKGFDRKMIEGFQKTGDNNTIVPIMRNLWAFDWKCYYCGWKHYQGNTPEKCGQCGKSDRIKKKLVWKAKERPQSKSYCFDAWVPKHKEGDKTIPEKLPHFQYFGEYTRRPEFKEALEKTGLTESMSIQGSCFLCTREKYWELKLCDESYGSWGNQGIEVACKTWLSGGRVVINHHTWYAHMFRTNGDFCPSYLKSGGISTTKKKVWEDIKNFKLVNQIHPVSWLVEKFAPVPGWDEESLNKLNG